MADYYASSGGSAGGDGSLGNPWDLATAFAATATVGAGDTLWLMEQSYTGRFTVALSGTDDANRVEVRPYDGYVVFDMVGSAGDQSDHGMVITGDFIDLWDIWVTSSNEERWQQQEDGGWRTMGDEVRTFFCNADNTGESGYEWFSGAEGGLIHGALIWNNGYDDTDRGHGHAIYTQNNGNATKTVDLCVMGYNMGGQSFNAFSIAGPLVGYSTSRNVSVDRFQHGGGTPADGGDHAGNHCLAGVLQLGFGAGVQNGTVTATDNVTPSGGVIQAGMWDSLTITGTIDGSQRDAVDIMASEYDNDRAVVVVYDAAAANAVEVDLTSLPLTIGREYILAHHLNPLGQGYTFTWDGSTSVTVRTDAYWTVANALGHDGADEGSQAPVPLGSAAPRRMAFVLAPSARWPAVLATPNAPSLGGIPVSTPTLDTATMWSVPKHVEENGNFTDLTASDRHTIIRSNGGYLAGGRDPTIDSDGNGVYAKLYNESLQNCPIIFPRNDLWNPNDRSFTVLARVRVASLSDTSPHNVRIFGNFSGSPGWRVFGLAYSPYDIYVSATDGVTTVSDSVGSFFGTKVGELWEYMLTWDNATGALKLYVCQPGDMPSEIAAADDVALAGANLQPASGYATTMAASNIIAPNHNTVGSYDVGGRLDWFGWAWFGDTILTPAQGQAAFAEMAAANTATSRRGLPGHRAPWIGVGIGV